MVDSFELWIDREVIPMRKCTRGWGRDGNAKNGWEISGILGWGRLRGARVARLSDRELFGRREAGIEERFIAKKRDGKHYLASKTPLGMTGLFMVMTTDPRRRRKPALQMEMDSAGKKWAPVWLQKLGDRE
jgi:hypothetical protein